MTDKTIKVHRSSVTGRFVSAADAAMWPASTIRQTVKAPVRKPKDAPA